MRSPSSETVRRVSYVSHHSSIVGGGEISLLTLIAGLRTTSWSPTLVVPERGQLSEMAIEAGASVLEAPMPTLRRPGPSVLGAVRSIRRQMKLTRPEIVHANGTRAMFYAGLGARAAGCPSLWHLRIPERDARFDPILVRLATASIAVSEATRDRLDAWPEAQERCRVIPNGLDLTKFVATRNRDDMRKCLGVRPDSTVVVSVARMVEFKRLDLLLEAVARLRPRNPDLECLIVGEGPTEASLRERAARKDLEGAVVFAGHREDIADVLAACDVFVITTPVEAFGRTVIEAMAAERPVVASNAGGPGEIVEDEETGLLVKPVDVGALAEAINRLLREPRLRRAMGAAGRQRAMERYTQQIHTKNVVDFYEQILGRNAPTSSPPIQP